MAKIILLTASFLFGLISTFAQDSDKLYFQEHETKLSLTCDELSELSSPEVFSQCKKGVEVSFTDARFSGGCAGTIERTWKAEDGCGRTTETKQYITLRDETPPVFFDVPEEMTLSKTDLESIEIPKVKDNCDSSVRIDTEETLIDIEGKSELLRVWIAVDDCGNQTRAETRIFFVD